MEEEEVSRLLRVAVVIVVRLRLNIEDQLHHFSSIGNYCRFFWNIGTRLYSLMMSLFIIGDIITGFYFFRN